MILKNKLLWVILSIITLVILFYFFLPKPIDMSLEKIGNGQNAVVFVYDPGLGVSIEQASEMNKARKIIGKQASFSIAKIGSPEGDSIARRYQAQPPTILFFNGEGELIDRQLALLSAAEIVKRLSNN